MLRYPPMVSTLLPVIEPLTTYIWYRSGSMGPLRYNLFEGVWIVLYNVDPGNGECSGWQVLLRLNQQVHRRPLTASSLQ